MKTTMKKVLSVLMVLAILLVPMTVMAEDVPLGDYSNPYQLSTTSVRFYVTVEPGVDAYIQVDDCNNSTVTVGMATGDYMLMYGRQAVYNNDDANKTATLTMQPYSDIFGVSNLTEETISVYMSLTAGTPVEVETGTMDNPEVLTLEDPRGMGMLSAYATQELGAGNQGHYYKVVAPADGAIAVSVNAYNPTDYSDVGWLFNANNMTAGVYGDYHTSADENPVYTEMVPVKANDEVVIFAATFNPDDTWNNPEGAISVNLGYVAKGSYEYPEVITETGDVATDMEAGTWGYYYTYVAPEAGEVTVTMNDAVWQYQINIIPADENDYGSYVYGEAHTSADDPVIASETVTVKAGDNVSIMVNTFNPEDTWNAPAGTVNWSLDFVAIKPLTFSIDNTNAYVGKEFDVVVNISENPGIISAKLDIGYDSEVLELVNVTEGDFTATDDSVVTDDEGNVIVNENGYSYGPADANPFAINWINPLTKENVATNGTFVILTFKVKDEAALGDTEITIDCNPNNVFDKDFNNVEFETVNATVTVSNHLPGDVNGDGSVNNRDYALLMQYLNKWEVTIVEAAADVTGDGQINNRDYALLMQYLNKWDVVLK